MFEHGLKSEVQSGGVDVVRLSTRVAGQILKAVLVLVGVNRPPQQRSCAYSSFDAATYPHAFIHITPLLLSKYR